MPESRSRIDDGGSRASRGSRAGGGKRADRAQQFMPFAALRGYYDLIRERERVAEPKRELTDEEALELSHKLEQVERREMASVVYYDGEAYVTVCGLVSDIDEAGRILTVVRTRIPFDDIAGIEVEGGE